MAKLAKLRTSGLIRTSSSGELFLDPYKNAAPVFGLVAEKPADEVEKIIKEMSESEQFHTLNQLTCELDDGFELSVLSVATIEDRIDTMKALIKLGADPNGNHFEPCPPLFYAASVSAVETLLAHGAHVNRPGIFNATPLLQVVKNFESLGSDVDLEIIRTLLAAGADPNIVDEVPEGEKECALSIVRASSSSALRDLFSSFLSA
eukprot:TRINITY_DN9536_c0_g1_i1.p1 TRINITY_DN9536_c0_g1~~TRINITY_DN9536_c0_g1_i1.p1  ORF type:complete len:215 (+),score=51.89 TRINITY_DN9536_c0_g1_i1:33-647(+)